MPNSFMFLGNLTDIDIGKPDFEVGHPKAILGAADTTRVQFATAIVTGLNGCDNRQDDEFTTLGLGLGHGPAKPDPCDLAAGPATTATDQTGNLFATSMGNRVR